MLSSFCAAPVTCGISALSLQAFHLVAPVPASQRPPHTDPKMEETRGHQVGGARVFFRGRVEGGGEAVNSLRIKMFVTITCKIASFDKCHEGKV